MEADRFFPFWVPLAMGALMDRDRPVYTHDGRRSALSKQAQKDRKKMNKAQAKARKRNRRP